MFSKIERTTFPPIHKPMMVWDGECSFCNYWVTRWQSKTQNKIEYKTLQEIAPYFKDIPLKEFKKASRLIEMDGNIYSGPDSAYKSFTYFENSIPIWHEWYANKKWFTKFSDYTYNFIAKNRSFMFTLTKLFFGKNPKSLKPYWLLELILLISAIYLLLKFL